MAIRRDATCYLETIVFLVEDRLFRVIRQPFLQSEVFKAMFTLPSGDKDTEGGSDENPIGLQSVNADEFQALVRAMMCETQIMDVTLKFEASSLSDEEWIAALKLSTMWEFSQTRDNAISALRGYVHSKPIDQILLGNNYRVSAWAMDGYRSLITGSVLESEEQLNHCGASLGWKDTAKILFYRQEHLNAAPQPPKLRLSDEPRISDDEVRKVFKIPYW